MAQAKTLLSTAWRGVCFDLDGVLIHTMPDHAAAWLATARRRGLPVSRQEVYRWEGEPGLVTATRLLRRAGKPAGLTAARAVLDDKERRFSDRVRRRRIRVPIAWLDALRRLRADGFRLALVTGTSRGEVDRAVPNIILRQFHVVVTGDAVRHGKPHPEPYRTACRRLRIPAASALVIENAPYGIRSARAAGAGAVIAVTSSLPASALRGARVILDTGGQLRRLLTGVRRARGA